MRNGGSALTQPTMVPKSFTSLQRYGCRESGTRGISQILGNGSRPSGIRGMPYQPEQ